MKNKYGDIIKILIVLGILANLFDFGTTFVALEFFGKTEANPVMNPLFDYPWIGYPLKILIGLWLFLPLKYTPYYFVMEKGKGKFVLLLMWAWIVLILYYGFVGIKNIFVVAG